MPTSSHSWLRPADNGRYETPRNLSTASQAGGRLAYSIRATPGSLLSGSILPYGVRNQSGKNAMNDIGIRRSVMEHPPDRKRRPATVSRPADDRLASSNGDFGGPHRPEPETGTLMAPGRASPANGFKRPKPLFLCPGQGLFHYRRTRQNDLNTSPCSDQGKRITRVPRASQKRSKAHGGASR